MTRIQSIKTTGNSSRICSMKPRGEKDLTEAGEKSTEKSVPTEAQLMKLTKAELVAQLQAES